MPENNPITDAELADVKRLHAAAVPVKRTMSWQYSDEEIVFYEATFNAFGPIIARLEAAERERDERTTMAARAQEALRYVMNGLPATDTVWAAYGNADSARAWLAARDDQQRREGAAEWLENAAREGGYYERSSEGMLEEAKQLREGGE